MENNRENERVNEVPSGETTNPTENIQRMRCRLKIILLVIIAVSFTVSIVAVVLDRERPKPKSPSTFAPGSDSIPLVEKRFRFTLYLAEEYTIDLENRNSSAYRKKSTEITEKLTAAFRNSSLKKVYSRTEIISLRNGSIAADVDTFFNQYPDGISGKPSAESVNVDISTVTEVIREKNSTGMLGLRLNDIRPREIAAFSPSTQTTIIPTTRKIANKNISSSCNSSQFQCLNGWCLDLKMKCDNKIQCPYHEDEIYCKCASDSYKCNSGICIPSSYRCDGYNDCGNDELGCSCSASQFRCSNGKCISINKRCDGDKHCSNNEDELNCNCTETSFVCLNRTCIPHTYQCDGSKDCLYGEDEENCNCTSMQYTCSSKKCITKLFLCDGFPNCPDGDDEENCTCGSNYYRCVNGLCIPNRFICDNYKDCRGGEDEENCGCRAGQFKCFYGKCINGSFVCDGEKNCRYGEDENGCFAEVTDSVNCDFEKDTCGYTASNLGEWQWISGVQSAWPRSDHTTETDQGHFLKVNENCFECPQNRTVTTPQTFIEKQGCVRFHYFLGRKRTETLTLKTHGEAGTQTVVTILNKYGKYAWNPAQFSIGPGSLRLSFITGNWKTLSKAAIDDVEITNGSCPPLVCESGETECPNHHLCIAKYRFCDGEIACPDGADEANCTTRSLITLRNLWQHPGVGLLLLNDGRRWVKICGFDWREAETKVACRMLGFNGYTRTIRSEYNTGNIAYSIKCNGTEKNLFNCSMCTTSILCRCKHHISAAVKCSNTPCKPGTFICPLSSNRTTVCITKVNLCDGLYDCPGGTDEMNCSTCASGMFKCKNHKCVLKGTRCDGKSDCLDNSDEFDCVRERSGSNIAEVAYNSTWVPLCYLNDSLVGVQLCTLLGKGNYISSDQAEVTSLGLVLEKTNVTHTLVPGYIEKETNSCPAMNLTCSNYKCGIRSVNFSPYIQFGNFAPLGKWPWQIGILHRQRKAVMCGGTLLNSRWVLTAAHCISYLKHPDFYRVLVGAVDFTDLGKWGKFYNVSEYIVHEHYRGKRYILNDFALLKLSTEVTMSDYVRPACLASKLYPTNTKCFATGWGRNEYGEYHELLRENNVKIISKEECGKHYSHIGKSEKIICISHSYPYGATCFGDSGGPLVCQNNLGRWELVGATSFGIGCTNTFSRGVFANVFEFKSWIEPKIKIF